MRNLTQDSLHSMLSKVLCAIFVILFACFTLAEEDLPVYLNLPSIPQSTQIEAGYPKGCLITSILYALKFGPSSWQKAYKSIPGSNDIKKIQSLAARFSNLQSRDENGASAFSEEYGTSPNDLPWMFQTLVASESSLSLWSIGWLPGSKLPRPDFLLQFLERVSTKLSEGKPVLAGLYYSNPDASHAVLITGILSISKDKKTLRISIFDPMTGKESEATIESSLISLVGHQAHGISFSAPSVANREGVLLSLLL